MPKIEAFTHSPVKSCQLSVIAAQCRSKTRIASDLPICYIIVIILLQYQREHVFSVSVSPTQAFEGIQAVDEV